MAIYRLDSGAILSTSRELDLPELKLEDVPVAPSDGGWCCNFIAALCRKEAQANRTTVAVSPPHEGVLTTAQP